MFPIRLGIIPHAIFLQGEVESSGRRSGGPYTAVEDDSRIAQMVAGFLARYQMEVSPASDAKDALRRV